MPLSFVHVTPQPPQLLVVLRLTSHPSPGSVLQSAKPASQLKPHELPEHVDVALAAVQALLHAPQWLGEELVLVSQPLLGSPSQSAYGAVQIG